VLPSFPSAHPAVDPTIPESGNTIGTEEEDKRDGAVASPNNEDVIVKSNDYGPQVDAEWQKFTVGWRMVSVAVREIAMEKASIKSDELDAGLQKFFGGWRMIYAALPKLEELKAPKTASERNLAAALQSATEAVRVVMDEAEVELDTATNPVPAAQIPTSDVEDVDVTAESEDEGTTERVVNIWHHSEESTAWICDVEIFGTEKTEDSLQAPAPLDTGVDRQDGEASGLHASGEVESTVEPDVDVQQDPRLDDVNMSDDYLPYHTPLSSVGSLNLENESDPRQKGPTGLEVLEPGQPEVAERQPESRIDAAGVAPVLEMTKELITSLPMQVATITALEDDVDNEAGDEHTDLEGTESNDAAELELNEENGIDDTELLPTNDDDSVLPGDQPLPVDHAHHPVGEHWDDESESDKEIRWRRPPPHLASRNHPLKCDAIKISQKLRALSQYKPFGEYTRLGCRLIARDHDRTRRLADTDRQSQRQIVRAAVEGVQQSGRVFFVAVAPRNGIATFRRMEDREAFDYMNQGVHTARSNGTRPPDRSNPIHGRNRRCHREHNHGKQPRID
jgi:hypothetical protein